MTQWVMPSPGIILNADYVRRVYFVALSHPNDDNYAVMIEMSDESERQIFKGCIYLIWKIATCPDQLITL